MSKDAYENKEKKMNIFQWIVYAGIIPLLIGLALFIFILEIAGVSVIDEVKKLPVISSFTEAEEATSEDTDSEIKRLQERVEDLESQLNEEKFNSNQLSLDLEDKESEIQTLLEEKGQLEQEIDRLNEAMGNDELDSGAIFSTYESMSPKKSAAIIAEMDEETALNILRNISEETLAKILENMPAENAAIYTAELAEEE
jgi:flagellar motility protein MotE (MotC chaperone)